MLKQGVIGTVYLICFDEPYGHARHYTGWSDDVGARLVAHRRGQGSRLMQVVTNAGITWRVVRVWRGRDRHYERKLKRRGSARQYCPRCTPTARNESEPFTEEGLLYDR